MCGACVDPFYSFVALAWRVSDQRLGMRCSEWTTKSDQVGRISHSKFDIGLVQSEMCGKVDDGDNSETY